MGLPVIDVLRTKHPDIRITDLDDEDQSQAFLGYPMYDDPVPIFYYEDYVARIAPKLSGDTNLSGVDGETLEGWSLWHMVHSDANVQKWANGSNG